MKPLLVLPKEVRLKRRSLNLADFKHDDPKLEDVSRVIDSSSLVYNDETNELMIVYLELEDDCRDIVEVLERTEFVEDTRRNGLAMRSRIFGKQPRSLPRRDFCNAATLAREDPTGHEIVSSYAEKVSAYYKQFNPEQYATHASQTEKIHPDWKMQDDGVFTSGIINFNSALRYHFDAGNFKNVWSNMLVFRKESTGGLLAIPEFDVAFALPHNSLIMFDGQKLMHGVTPIVLHSEDAYRFSVVFYSLKQLWNCLPINDEIIRAQERRTEREFRRAGLT